MRVIANDTSIFLLRFDENEEMLTGIKKFCKEKKFSAGVFHAIGAAKEVLLSYYNLETKQYEDMLIEEDVEIAGIIGNVATMQGEIMIHAHGSFGDRRFQVNAGHVKRLIISATGEVTFTLLSGIIKRKFDKKTGLNLLA